MTASTASNSTLKAHLPPPLHLTEGSHLDTAAAADLLGCTTRTVINLIRRGHLKATRRGPGRTAYKIAVDELLAFALLYGLHDPATVAAVTDLDDLPDFTPEPVTLLTTRTPDGLLVISPAPPEQQE